MALSGAVLLPFAQEDLDLGLPAHEPGQAAASGHVEPGARGGFTHHPEYLDRLRQTFEFTHAQRLKLKIPIHEFVSGGADGDGVRGCDRLDARGDVERVAESHLLPVSTPVIADYHQASMDADTDLQTKVSFFLQSAVQCRDSVHNNQSALHRASRVVFLRLRIPKEHQDAIAEIIGHVAVGMLAHGPTDAVILMHHGVQIFRIQFLR